MWSASPNHMRLQMEMGTIGRGEGEKPLQMSLHTFSVFSPEHSARHIIGAQWLSRALNTSLSHGHSNKCSIQTSIPLVTSVHAHHPQVVTTSLLFSRVLSVTDKICPHLWLFCFELQISSILASFGQPVAYPTWSPPAQGGGRSVAPSPVGAAPSLTGLPWIQEGFPP